LFDQAGGGIVCRQCAAPEGTYQMLSPTAYERIKNVVNGSIDWENAPLPPAAAIDEIVVVAERFYGYHLGGGRLKSLEFVRRVAGPATSRGEDV
jgi:recombinational DNA repair protein (RecF pathway)